MSEKQTTSQGKARHPGNGMLCTTEACATSDRQTPRDPERRDPPSYRAARRITSHTRFLASIPAVGLFICAVVLAVATLVHVIIAVYELCTGAVDLAHLSIEFVEYADLFLLSVALYILSLGLICLFVSDRIPLPCWLEFHDFDDLKERLASVICIMLGVYFLGYILEGHTGTDTLWLGLASAIIIVALGFFVSNVFLHKE